MQMHAQIIRQTCVPVSEIRRRISFSSVHADIKLVCNSRSAGGSLVCACAHITLVCACAYHLVCAGARRTSSSSS